MYVKNSKFITQTGFLISITILLQMLGRYVPLGPYNNFVIGSLVNSCLFITEDV